MSTRQGQHTPEPWRIEDGCIVASWSTSYPATASDGREFLHPTGLIALVYGPGAAPAQPGSNLANMRRIVAAVNACRGILTEALEAGVVGELVEALRDARDVIDAVAPVMFNPAVQDYLPHGLRERVEAWLRSAKADAVLTKLPATGQKGA